MAEEFQEFEVIFQENFVDKQGVDVAEECIPASAYLNSVELVNCSKEKRKKVKLTSEKNGSVPVNIPGNAWFGYTVDGDDGEMVPPHIIIGRRVAGKMMSFSVCTGNGRTLKGRDLSEVRNSILRKTGFLET
ncbi:protein S40-1-like [Primulina huaijiensis]|uniref:protein S40-1-like n=1 Tax=Primulina huaijiensis TaxID=1492673 RepID=UPI003CC73216